MLQSCRWLARSPAVVLRWLAVTPAVEQNNNKGRVARGGEEENRLID